MVAPPRTHKGEVMDKEILDEMKANGLNKQQQLQKWGEEQLEILKRHGGTISDIPIDPTHEYYALDAKIRALSKLNVK